MRKAVIIIFSILLSLYVLICLLLYANQETLIFHPTRLSQDHQFQFDGKFEEVNLKAVDGVTLNGVLFRADSSKGVILYFHGNAGSLESWGHVAQTYVDLHYDVMMIDYRGYGKSQGKITNEQQFFDDAQTCYDFLKATYSENNIIVLGYSMGTGVAAKVASISKAKLLILQAPYYSLTDMMKKHFSFIPTFILKYKFQTDQYIKGCRMSIVIFHGDQDDVIPYSSSVELQKSFKPGDRLIRLPGAGHNGMTSNPDYVTALREIL